MNNFNPESIPTYIFDWLEKYSFSSLDEEQQKQVLLHFSEEEYDELHKNTFAIKSLYETFPSENSAERKQHLLNHFETRHENKKTILVFNNTFWKAAAMLVLLGCGWLLNYLIPGKKASDIGSLTMMDTVYINKEIMSDPLKIYDTIYIEKKSTPGNKMKDSYNSYTRNPYSTPIPENNSTLNFEELGNPLNRQKRNSMKDDSLVKEFSAIML